MKPLRIYPEFFNHVIISSSRVSGCGGQHLICSHDGSCQLWLWSPKGPQLVQHMDILDKSLHPSGFQAGGYSRFKFCKIWHDTIIYFVRYFMMLYGSKLVDQNGWRVFRWWKNLRWAELKAYELSRSILQEPCSLWSHPLDTAGHFQNGLLLTSDVQNGKKLVTCSANSLAWISLDEASFGQVMSSPWVFPPGLKRVVSAKGVNMLDFHRLGGLPVHINFCIFLFLSVRGEKKKFWILSSLRRNLPSPVQHVSHLSEL